mgnify:CR=1 FL=1
MTRILLIVATFLFAPLSFANDSPVGLWKTIDDKTNKPRSIVRIVEENGEGEKVGGIVVMRPSSASISTRSVLRLAMWAKASLGFIAGCRSDRYISVVSRAMSPLA